jgi:hypothetical protein
MALIEGEEQTGGDAHSIVVGEHLACVAQVPLASHASTHGARGGTTFSKEQAKEPARLIA